MAAPGRTAKPRSRRSFANRSMIRVVVGPANLTGRTLGKIRNAVTHVGRRVHTSPEERNRWLGREVSEPVQIAAETDDLTSQIEARIFVCSETHACSEEETSEVRGKLGHLRGYDSSQGKTSASPLVVSAQLAIQHSAMLGIRPEEPTRLCTRAAEVSAPNWR
jgi:hypothetical protein